MGKSMLDREQYGLGGAISKLGKYASKKLDEAQGISPKSPGRTSEDRGVVVGKKRTRAYKNTEQIKGAAKGAGAVSLLTAGASKSWEEENSKDPSEKQASAFEKAFSKAHNSGKETFMFKGKEYSTDVRKGKALGGNVSEEMSEEDGFRMMYNSFKQEMKEAESPEEQKRIQQNFQKQTQNVDQEVKMNVFKEEDRTPKAEGGSMLVPPEMGMEEEMPVDTYTPEEQAMAEESQLPDVQMEDDYMGYVLGESLDDGEQDYLMGALESDPRLSEIFDKVVMTASEFSGAGKVEGPGDGVSDSIPARLSDGEFVITEKATDQIGADNLQLMMDDAERMADGGLARQTLQIGGLLSNPMQKDQDPTEYDVPYTDKTDEEINKSMLGSNRMPSLKENRLY